MATPDEIEAQAAEAEAEALELEAQAAEAEATSRRPPPGPFGESFPNFQRGANILRSNLPSFGEGVLNAPIDAVKGVGGLLGYLYDSASPKTPEQATRGGASFGLSPLVENVGSDLYDRVSNQSVAQTAADVASPVPIAGGLMRLFANSSDRARGLSDQTPNEMASNFWRGLGTETALSVEGLAAPKALNVLNGKPRVVITPEIEKALQVADDTGLLDKELATRGNKVRQMYDGLVGSRPTDPNASRVPDLIESGKLTKADLAAVNEVGNVAGDINSIAGATGSTPNLANSSTRYFDPYVDSLGELKRLGLDSIFDAPDLPTLRQNAELAADYAMQQRAAIVGQVDEAAASQGMLTSGRPMGFRNAAANRPDGVGVALENLKQQVLKREAWPGYDPRPQIAEQIGALQTKLANKPVLTASDLDELITAGNSVRRSLGEFDKGLVVAGQTDPSVLASIQPTSQAVAAMQDVLRGEMKNYFDRVGAPELYGQYLQANEIYSALQPTIEATTRMAGQVAAGQNLFRSGVSLVPQAQPQQIPTTAAGVAQRVIGGTSESNRAAYGLPNQKLQGVIDARRQGEVFPRTVNNLLSLSDSPLNIQQAVRPNMLSRGASRVSPLGVASASALAGNPGAGGLLPQLMPPPPPVFEPKTESITSQPDAFLSELANHVPEEDLPEVQEKFSQAILKKDSEALAASIGALVTTFPGTRSMFPNLTQMVLGIPVDIVDDKVINDPDRVRLRAENARSDKSPSERAQFADKLNATQTVYAKRRGNS